MESEMVAQAYYYQIPQQHISRISNYPRTLKTAMIIEKTFTGSQSIQKLKYTNQSTLLELLESIFDDVTLYNDPEIRAILEKSEKGFMTVEEIMGLGIFREFMDRNVDIFISPDEICRVANEESKKLIAVNYRIKRVQAFVDNISNQVLKSVYIQKLPNKSTNQIYQFFKNLVGVVYQIYHKKNQRWVIIVIDNYEVLDRIKDELYFGENKLVVLPPLQTLSSYGENQRLSSEFNIVRLYNNKSLFELPDSEEERVDEDNQKYLERRFRNLDEEHSFKPPMELQNIYDRQFNQYFAHHQDYIRKPPKTSNKGKQSTREEQKLRKKMHKSRKNKSDLKRQIDEVMNYDNSALLSLRSEWNNEMMQE